jgi:sigma-B regulation protein RsbU (phosphoserine phosphatase)
VSRRKILLALEHKRNTSLLQEWLATKYDAVVADRPEALEEPFDLCITDGRSLARLWERMQARKDRENPVFLPFVLLSTRQDVGMSTRRVWESIDELLVAPVEKAELAARVEMLLRSRDLSRQNFLLRRQLEAELASAAGVQAALLPEHPPALPGFELAARCLPARDVGGDFYDWEEAEDGTFVFTLADVAGKGMSAALLMATLRATLRAVSHQNPPARALKLAERALSVDFERSGRFATLFHGHLDVAQASMRFVDAGHGHVFVRRANGTVEGLEPRGLPLGAFPGERYREGSMEFRPGDALVVYSDGLVEGRHDDMPSPHTLAERIAPAGDATGMVERLLEFAAPDGRPDDLTVVVLRRCAN